MYRRLPPFKNHYPFWVVFNVAVNVNRQTKTETLSVKSEFRAKWWEPGEQALASESGVMGLEIPLPGVKFKLSCEKGEPVSSALVNHFVVENVSDVTNLKGFGDTDFLSKGLPNNEKTYRFEDLSRFEVTDAYNNKKIVALPGDTKAVTHTFNWDSEKARLYLKTSQIYWVDYARELSHLAEKTKFQEYFDNLKKNSSVTEQNMDINSFRLYSALMIFNPEGRWLNPELRKSN
jgi:hypothetical protein